MSIIRIQQAIVSAYRSISDDEKGATAVEYGLIVGLIAVVLVVAIAALSGALGDMFTGITNVLKGNVPTNPTP